MKTVKTQKSLGKKKAEEKANKKRALAQQGFDKAMGKWEEWLEMDIVVVEMDIGFGSYQDVCNKLGDPSNSSVVETVLYEIEEAHIKRMQAVIDAEEQEIADRRQEVEERKRRQAIKGRP
jgi:hypothetical protein